MKGTGKIVLTISMLSLLFLLHVHEQIMIFHVSYRLHDKSTLLTRRSDEYRRLKFEVDQLMAPRILEEKLKDQPYELTLPEEVRVVKIPKLLSHVQTAALSEASSNTFSGKVFNFLGRWIDVAQAKTDN